MEIKMTTKTTKQGLVNVLKEAKVTDKNLKERIKYALDMFNKDMTKVSKNDLFELVQEVVDHLAPKAPAPVEASLKPKKTSGKAPKETEKTTEELVEDIFAEEEVEPVKKEKKRPTPKPRATEFEKEAVRQKTASVVKKGGITKAKKSEEKVEVLLPASNVGADYLPSAKLFPKEIDHPELGKLVACVGEYTEYADIMQALEEEKTLYFAAYWTKRHIREYNYALTRMVNPDTVKHGFPYDLDMLMAVLPCETMERVYAMSRYTEALFQFEGVDFKYLEDTDPRSGEKYQIRVSAGMEFEIYRPADEEITK